MKQIIFIFMSLLCFSCSSKAQNQTADTNVQSDKKILVAYFSCTGTTEKAADAKAACEERTEALREQLRVLERELAAMP